MARATPWFRRPLPRQSFSAVLVIIALNLLAYLLNRVFPVSQFWMAMNPVMVIEDGAWWQLVTYMYVHGDLGHILLNMLALFFFGLALEEDLGSWEFLLFYHVTGMLAATASLGIAWVTGQNLMLLGASGAIFGVMLAFAAFRPRSTLLLFFVIPLSARSMVILWTAFEVFSQIFNPYEGVSHLTHLAGFVVAFVYLLVRFRLNAWKALWSS